MCFFLVFSRGLELAGCVLFCFFSVVFRMFRGAKYLNNSLNRAVNKVKTLCDSNKNDVELCHHVSLILLRHFHTFSEGLILLSSSFADR